MTVTEGEQGPFDVFSDSVSRDRHLLCGFSGSERKEEDPLFAVQGEGLRVRMAAAILPQCAAIRHNTRHFIYLFVQLPFKMS